MLLFVVAYFNFVPRIIYEDLEAEFDIISVLAIYFLKNEVRCTRIMLYRHFWWTSFVKKGAVTKWSVQIQNG